MIILEEKPLFCLLKVQNAETTLVLVAEDAELVGGDVEALH